MKNQAATALNSRIALCAKSSHKRQKEGTFTMYGKVVKYPFETYATDDIIAITDAEIMKVTHPPDKILIEYA